MSSYFLVSNNSDIMNVIRELPIEKYSMTIGKKRGIVVNQSLEELSSMFDKTFKKIENIKKVFVNMIGSTSYEGIEEVSLSIDDPKKVVVKDWNGNGIGKPLFVQATADILSSVIKTQINIYVPHGNVRESENRTGFNIFMWSSPVNNKSVGHAPETIFGYRVDCRDSPFSSSHIGITIYDDSNDYEVAEIINNCLYIHHDICHHGSKREINMYRRILEEVKNEILASPEDREKELIKKLGLNRNTYIDMCSKRMDKDKQNAVKVNVEEKKKIKEYQVKIIESLRSIKRSDSLINNLDGELEKEKSHYGEEFDKLLSLDKVIGLEVSEKGINVFTDIIYCEDSRNKKIHELGKYKITIPIGNGFILWDNLTRKVNGYQDRMNAPHVFGNRKACLGSLEEVIPELIATYQFSVIAMLAIQFLESANVEDSAGKFIYKWPVKKSKKEKDE